MKTRITSNELVGSVLHIPCPVWQGTEHRILLQLSFDPCDFIYTQLAEKLVIIKSKWIVSIS